MTTYYSPQQHLEFAGSANTVNRSTATPNLCPAPGQNGPSSHPKDQRPSNLKSVTSNHSATTTQSTSATAGFPPTLSLVPTSGYPSRSKGPRSHSTGTTPGHPTSQRVHGPKQRPQSLKAKTPSWPMTRGLFLAASAAVVRLLDTSEATRRELSRSRASRARVD